MSVSAPFCTPSWQVGIWQRSWMPASVVDAEHTPLAQSETCKHIFSGPHGAHFAPPQSTSVSSASILPSVQCASTQMPSVVDVTPLQRLLAQSAFVEHATPSAHVLLPLAAVAHDPPQSTPVSSPFLMPSPHEGARQSPRSPPSAGEHELELATQSDPDTQ
jgi:hypothetical protein